MRGVHVHETVSAVYGLNRTGRQTDLLVHAVSLAGLEEEGALDRPEKVVDAVGLGGKFAKWHDKVPSST